jgi:hypothetical protein
MSAAPYPSKPHDYRCGITLVGVANCPRVIENWPPFWRNRHFFARFRGDVHNPVERAEMLANSPHLADRHFFGQRRLAAEQPFVSTKACMQSLARRRGNKALRCLIG